MYSRVAWLADGKICWVKDVILINSICIIHPSITASIIHSLTLMSGSDMINWNQAQRQITDNIPAGGMGWEIFATLCEMSKMETSGDIHPKSKLSLAPHSECFWLLIP